MPFEERGNNRRNSPASCSLSSTAGGSRRVLSISLEAAATAGRTRSAPEITFWSPARTAEPAISVSKEIPKAILVETSHSRRSSDASGQFIVDLLDRLASG